MSIANFVTGLQSIDQVFFGLGIGIWAGYLCDSFLRKPLDRHITQLLNGEYHVRGYSRLFKCLLCIVVVDFIFISGIFALVSRQESNKWRHSDWKQRIDQACPENIQVNRLSFAEAEYAAAFT